jgi:hypothetical protein
MGHGAWMKIAWGTWKMGGWGWNITPERLHVSVGYVWGAWATSASKRALDRLPKLWHVSVGGRFWGSSFELMFHGASFSTSGNECWAVTETWHVFVSVCFRAPLACAWKPTPGHLKTNDAFFTSRWNNIKGCSVCVSRQ